MAGWGEQYRWPDLSFDDFVETDDFKRFLRCKLMVWPGLAHDELVKRGNLMLEHTLELVEENSPVITAIANQLLECGGELSGDELDAIIRSANDNSY